MKINGKRCKVMTMKQVELSELEQKKQGRSFSYERVLFGEGTIVDLGSNVSETDTGVGTYTTVVVMMDDGKLVNPPVEFVEVSGVAQGKEILH